MTGKQLRTSIQQEAIAGRLVPQDPTDEPASKLLEKIRKEKEKLIKEGKLAKDKNETLIFRGDDKKFYEQKGKTVTCINDQIPFEIPDSWEWCRLSSLCLSLTDGTHSTPKYTNSGVPFVSVKDMSSGTLDLSNTKYISREDHEILAKRCNPQKGDILLSKVGTTGVPTLVTTEEEFSLFVSVALIKFNSEKIDKNFFVYLLQSPFVQEQATGNTKGVGNPNWVLSDIANTLMVLPPLEEQKRIASALSSVDDLIASLDKQIAKTRDIKQAALHQLLTALPNTSCKPLREVGQIQRGTSITRKNIVEGEIPVIAGGQLPAYYCNKSNRSGETITVAGSGEYAGYVAYWETPIFVSDAFSIKGSELCRTKYLYYVLKSMQREIYTTKKGAGVPHVHFSDIENFLIPLPSTEKQKHIADVLTSFDDTIEGLEAKRQKYESIKAGMMQQLLTGTIRLS